MSFATVIILHIREGESLTRVFALKFTKLDVLNFSTKKKRALDTLTFLKFKSALIIHSVGAKFRTQKQDKDCTGCICVRFATVVGLSDDQKVS